MEEMNFGEYLKKMIKLKLKNIFLSIRLRYHLWRNNRLNDKLLRLSCKDNEQELVDYMSKEQKEYLVQTKILEKKYQP